MTATLQTYDPFVRGPFPVGVQTIEASDSMRERLFPCEIWYPAAAAYRGRDTAPETQDVFTVPQAPAPRRQAAVRNAAADPGTYPLIVFSHHSGGPRRMATFLTTHLSSHGYVVAAMDHSEAVVPALARRAGETDEDKAARLKAAIDGRVPDVRFLLDHLLNGEAWKSDAQMDPARIGIAGHSFGGWTALAAVDADPRIRAAVALAPGGSSHPRPGILAVKLAFEWGRDVPTLLLAAENDVSLPIDGMYEIFDRIPASKQMVILRRADHVHFMDNVEELHETVRTTPFSGELAWINEEMRPISELCSGEDAHVFVRGLTTGHMDAFLKERAEAQRFLAADIQRELARRGIDAIVPDSNTKRI